MALQLKSIVDSLGGTLHGDPDVLIQALAPLGDAGPGELTFLSNPKYRQQLAASRAACVIVGEAIEEAARARGACIVTPDPYLYFARLTQLWARENGQAAAPGIHPSAVVDAEAVVDPTATIGPLCVVERGARIGAHTVLKSRVTVGERCVVGARGILHSGVVIGADGFGFAPFQKTWEKIEQLGAVTIGDDVEIGANTCIDRGAIRDTVIEDGVKLDNLIQIGHNVHIGKHTAIAGCTAIAGSTHIGAYCTLAGASRVVGHLTLVDGVHITATTLVTRSLLKPGVYSGSFPFDENAKWEKNAATLKHLHSLRERIRALEKRNEQGDSEP